MNNNKKCKLKKSWINTELEEHGHLFKKEDRLRMVKNITRNHVSELGCGYYPELFKMEKRLRRKI